MNENSTIPCLEKVMRENDFIAAEFDPAGDGEKYFLDVDRRARAQKALEVSTRFLLDFFSRKRGSL